METRFCVAYNYKEKSKENEINCQLTHSVDHKFERGSSEDSCWMFYETAGERMVSQYLYINLHPKIVLNKYQKAAKVLLTS